MPKTGCFQSQSGTFARTRRVSGIVFLTILAVAGSLSGVLAQGDTQAPTVTGWSPAQGSVNVTSSINVMATLSEPVQAASIAFSLRDANSVLVPATVTYDSATRTATLDPVADLSPSSSYTATLSAAADLAGNVLSGPVTWSFATGAQGFADSVVFSGLVQPVSIQFASDGRVFVAEKGGIIKVFDNLSDTTPTVFADLNVNVYNSGAAGLTGLALDPSFPTKPYVYVVYAYDAAIGGVAPRWGTPGVIADPCPNSGGQGCVVSGRLSRLQASGNVMTGTETVLVADWFQQYPNHSVGSLAFGPDGALYASAGDGAGLFVDSGQVGNPNNDPVNEGGALRSQDLRTPADPTTLDGAIIRIDPDTGKELPRTPSMVVGPSTVDENNVRTFPVVSVFQGPDPTDVRILEPTNPAAGKPHRFLYVLPVAAGVTNLSSQYSDGLEELRLLDVPNRFNVTLIAPSFGIEPWYGDHDTDPDRRLESFVVKDLVPFGDSFAAPGEVVRRWALGFSKSGSGALSLILRNPNVFNAAVAWDAPTQFTNMSAFAGMSENFGTEENFDLYEIPALVSSSAEAFRTRNRLWISGDTSMWTSHMAALHTQMGQAAVLHTWVAGGTRNHSWSSGWLNGAVGSLDANAAASNTALDANANRIVAYGLRNPFRFTFRPGTREMWVGDAGASQWEEINRLADASDGVLENFGWPCFEGQGTTAYSAGLSLCTRLSAQPSALTPPFFAYQHAQPIGPGDPCSIADSSIAGLAFYGTGSYPAAYHGALFFADYARNCVAVMLKDATGLPDPATRATVLSDAAGPVDLKVGSGGDLFYASLDTGAIRRIQYQRGNLAPTAVAQATPTSGEPPLGVTFSAAASSDPANDTLTFAWDLDGDGAFDDGASAQVTFTYTTPGAHTARLRVTDAGGLSDVAAVVVTAHNTAPVASIASPTAAATWAVGETISFSGGATDPEEGPLAASKLSWSVILHDCPSSCTQQTLQNFTGVSGGSFVTPDNRYPSHLEIRLTATDSGGLQSTTSVLINPRTATLTFLSAPSGLSLTVGGVSTTTPFTRTVIVSSRNTIAATSPQVLGGTSYQFLSWSDSGTQTHDVTPASSITYTATYTTSVPGLVAAYNFNESSGTSVVDSSGNNLTGAITGATRVTGGRVGGALSFNGTSNMVTVNSAAPLNLTTGMTLEAWVNPTSLGTAWRNVIIKERPNGETYNLYANTDTSGPVAYTALASSPAAPTWASTTTKLTANTWTHLAVSYDSTTLRLYVNGVQAGTRVQTGAMVTSTGALRIGGNSIWGEYFAGLIDEVRVYNRALTATEIQTDMVTPVGAPPSDSTPPVLSNGQPSTALPAGTTQTTLSLSTNETATCRYGATAGVAYGAMTNTFTVTNSTSHSTPASGLTNGGSYTFYVRCQDTAANVNTNDFAIAFSVSQPPADTTPPVRSNGGPSGTLPFGTTQALLTLTTNEMAVCRYATTPGVAYGAMAGTFTSTGSTAHSTTVTALVNGGSYNYYVRCQDAATNANPDDFGIGFTVAATPPDTTPPVRSNGGPSGTLPFGTTQALLTLTTNEMAVCRYATTPGVAYGAMAGTFTSTGSTAHSTTVTGLVNGGSYNYYVRCQDAATNANPDDFGIGFTVAATPPDTTPPVRSNGGPSGTLPFGTAQALLTLTTSEMAVCRYATTPGVAYGAMAGTFTSTGSTAHSTTVSALVNGGSYNYYVRCQDTATNANPDDFGIGFTVAATPPDTTPPVRSNGQPTGALTAGTTQTSLTLTTNEAATCRYATTTGVAYSAMSSTFATTGSTAHSTTVTGLVNGGSYNYYVRCQDAATNANPDDFGISFTVAQPTATGLVAAYSFNEASGTTVTDSSGNNLTGTINGATRVTTGKFGGALSFNGTSNMVTVNSATPLNLTTGMTLEAWVYPTTLGSAWRNVIIKERANGEVYNLYAHTDANRPVAYAVAASSPGAPVDVQGTAALTLNTWTHLAVSYDNTTLRLYVNGTQVGTRALSGAMLTSTGALRIGGNTIWGEYFAGTIDEVRIYNRALTATEILADTTRPITP